MVVSDKVMTLAKQLYGSDDITFLIRKSDELGGISPLTCILRGETDKVVSFLKAEIASSREPK